MNFDDVGYYEPSQAEMIMDEFMGKMRDALTYTAKNEIDQLRHKNAQLEEENKKLRQQGQKKAVDKITMNIPLLTGKEHFEV